MPNGNSELPELPAPRCTYADHSYPAFMKQQMIDYARAALSVCADGGKGEAVYQVMDDGHWTDVEKDLFDCIEPEGRRIVYTTPQAECAPRADADTAGVVESLLVDITAVDTWYRGSPSYEHDAGWFKDRVIRLLEERIAAGASNERAPADAEKDEIGRAHV